MTNKLRELWRADKTVANVFLGIPSGYATEVLAQAGWDSMTVDLQHGVQDYHSMVACFQAMLGHAAVPLARVPANEAGIIGKVLDAGAFGVICPLVNSRADAERLVAACRYPPDGIRSNGAIRPSIYQDPGAYIRESREAVVVMAMIESREAVENLEAILDVPGLDAVYVGPNDLGLSLGFGAKMERDEDEILRFYERLIAETRARGLFAGIHCASAAYARRMVETGFRLVTHMNDAWLMLKSGREAAADLLALSDRRPAPPPRRPAGY